MPIMENCQKNALELKSTQFEHLSCGQNSKGELTTVQPQPPHLCVENGTKEEECILNLTTDTLSKANCVNGLVTDKVCQKGELANSCVCSNQPDNHLLTHDRSKNISEDTNQLSEDQLTSIQEPVLPNLDDLTIAEAEEDILDGINYVVYKSELQMPDIMRLITKDLSEPYSIYTYRYFIHNWPKLCFLAMDQQSCVGAIVCKLDLHKKVVRRGYIAMLAVDQKYRRRKIGSHLVLKAIRGMIQDDCDEVVLETEITNKGALHLYENLGFVRDKRLFRYYLNGVDALRLKLWLR